MHLMMLIQLRTIIAINIPLDTQEFLRELLEKCVNYFSWGGFFSFEPTLRYSAR